MREVNPGDRDRSTNPVSRRDVLQLVGVAGLTAVGGCTGTPERTYRSRPVILSREAENFGVWPDQHRLLTGSWEPGIGDLNVSVAMTSHLVTYGHELANGSINLGFLSTPNPTALGQGVNPVADASFSEILSGDVGGRLGDRADLDLAGAVDWWRSPEVVGSFEVTMMGEETTAEALAGVEVDSSPRPDGRETRDLVMNLVSRVARDDEVVIAVLGTSTPVITDSERNSIVLDAEGNENSANANAEDNDCIERTNDGAETNDNADDSSDREGMSGGNLSRTEITEDDTLATVFRPNPALVSLAQSLMELAIPLYILRASEEEVVYHTPTGEPLDYASFDVDGVEVPNIAWEDRGDGDGRVREEVSLAFGQVEILYTPQSCEGAAKGAVSASWDQMSVSS